jgi:hypothetical protein
MNRADVRVDGIVNRQKHVLLALAKYSPLNQAKNLNSSHRVLREHRAFQCSSFFGVTTQKVNINFVTTACFVRVIVSKGKTPAYPFTSYHPRIPDSPLLGGLIILWSTVQVRDDPPIKQRLTVM